MAHPLYGKATWIFDLDNTLYPASCDLFAQIDVMTNGGPLDSTQTIVFQAIERGYGKQDISGGSAISVILFVIVLSISLIQRWLTREKT